MTMYMYVTTIFSLLMVVFRLGYSIGASSKEGDVSIDWLGLTPYASVGVWGLTLIIQGALQ